MPDTDKAPRRRKARAVSPITWRILAVNLVALGVLIAGLLYLGEYRRNLVAAEVAALETQAAVFAAALGEGSVAGDYPGTQKLLPENVRQMVRRVAETTGIRARLFDVNGKLMADSRLLLGPGGEVQIEELPPPETGHGVAGTFLDLYDRLISWIPFAEDLPVYREDSVQLAGDYEEVTRALRGEAASAVRAGTSAGLVLGVAVPVQRYKQVLGALMLSKESHDIDAALFEVRLGILEVFLVALAVTVMLSIYLAGTIARPIRRLAAAAEGVRHGRLGRDAIPDLMGRDDEIGDLAASLSDMTEALWRRLDAIERFAADVTHEIKNPLTSLQSAVETAARIDDPEQQRKLMDIIQEDVQRLDRLISDISEASRLDTELSRAESAPVDLGLMLRALVEVEHAADSAAGARLRLESDRGEGLIVDGIEGRLVQVFRNLIANSLSFSPPESTVSMMLKRDGEWIEAIIDDNGPGIPGGKEEAIFERFYSERPAREKFGTHSGLGLSISRQIVEAHGGTITAGNRYRSDGGIAGARFTVRLPAGG